MGISARQITEIVDYAVHNTLLKLGVIKDLVSRAEMYRRFGKKSVDNAIANGTIQRHRNRDTGRYMYSIKEWYQKFESYEMER